MSEPIHRLDRNSVHLHCPNCKNSLEQLFTVQQGPVVLFGCPHCNACLNVQLIAGKVTDYRVFEVDGEPSMDVPLTKYEMQLFFRSLLINDETLDELKSAPLAKMRNALERWEKLDEQTR